ncbi:CaiB/BaiF CoA transferase family protein [Chelatococcus reniformis]|uniref:CoA transferase n=1 Tax=Chelatococcus reniformis TaxID=1494448 RepID=A0A916XAR3_9HYPH|nr:CoA transferase [Chelatococcus reniformis]GGC59489.1 CoA transferase [Chelatococcus reniformis]
MDEPFGALQGLRVLDLTQALAGPFCTQILADHGAEVIKLEPPESGDMARLSGPFHAADTAHRQSGYFHSINRNKKSIVIDLKQEAGRQIVLDLVPRFEVVVENFRAGVMDKLGLSYERLRERNPRLVYAVIRGFGDRRTGASPYADWPAYDVVAQAMGGMMGVTGADADHPVKVGPGVGDTVPALYLAVGILAAVLRARATGEGQFVDVAMLDAILGVSERIVHQRSFSKVVAEPEGNHHPFIAPFGIFPASDGHVAIACPSDHFFHELCRQLDAADLLDDAGLATLAGRRDNRRRVVEAVGARTARFTKAELTARLGGRVPFGPVYDMDEIGHDPHFAARAMLADIDCPGIPETMQIAGIPIKLTATPGRVVHRGPGQGEHTDTVLRQAGFAASDLAAWRQAGIIK